MRSQRSRVGNLEVTTGIPCTPRVCFHIMSQVVSLHLIRAPRVDTGKILQTRIATISDETNVMVTGVFALGEDCKWYKR